MLIRNCSLIVFGRRVHHYQAGLAMAALGVLLAIDDRADLLRWWRQLPRWKRR